MKTVVVTSMIAEPNETDDPSGLVFCRISKPKSFKTMNEAKAYIEDEISRVYFESGSYSTKEIVRRERDGVWLVTVYYDAGQSEYQAAEMDIA